MSNSTKLITLLGMVQDLHHSVITARNNNNFRSGRYADNLQHQIGDLYEAIENLCFEEGSKLAETSNEENDPESGDHPDHLKVVEVRRGSAQVRGGDVTIEVAVETPDSGFSRLERDAAAWREFFTPDGMPIPYYNRRKAL